MCYVCTERGGVAIREILCFQFSKAVRFKCSLCSSVNKPYYCKTTDPILDKRSLNAPHAKGRSRD